MTILVTGGAGFIGSHLVERLLADDEYTVLVDDLRSAVWSRDDIDALRFKQHSNLSYGQCSIQQYDGFYAVLGGLQGIFHLASPVGPAGILPYRGKIVEEIVSATYAVIQMALKYKCRLVYVSTSEIYGGGQQGLCREDMACVTQLDKPSARLEYAIGKMAGEIAVLNTPGLDAVIVRPFNVSGARQLRKGGFVMPTFVQQALAGEPLTVFGDGSAIRAFTHVNDIVDGLLLAMELGKAGEAYNLGNQANKTTIEDLAYKVLWVFTGAQGGYANAGVVHIDGRDVYGPDYHEAADKYPDASKAMSDLGWKPTRSIEVTIRDVIAYERSKLNVK